MTERGRASVQRTATSLAIGPSALKSIGEELVIDVAEWAVPIPRRIRGRIRVRPVVELNRAFELEPGRRHHWTPVWPAARVELHMDNPSLRWSGSGYLDHNRGSEPLGARFHSWSWSRALTSTGPIVLYDTRLMNGQEHSLALHFPRDGEINELSAPPCVALPKSRWGMARPTRSENAQAEIVNVWEDTPFYTRSQVATHLVGARVDAVHESLSLQRFISPWVQWMLPFRMPRKR
jgi:carotenoid 1,2-hydratase